MKKVYVVGSKRSPIGKFLGSLYEADYVEVTNQVLNELFLETNINKSDIKNIIVGNVVSAAMGQGLARNIAISAGLPVDSIAYSVNMVCGSGMKAIANAYQDIQCGADVVLAGGVELMSNIPYATNSYIRLGKKFGDFTMTDLMVHDGLTDAFSGVHMGVTAENIAKHYNITRQEQDEYANLTQSRAIKAVDEGKFKDEIVPIKLKDYKNNEYVFDTDEFPNRTSNLEKLSKLKPTFIKDGSGTVTAGNTSGINDGCAFVILASEEYCRKNKLVPICELVSFANIGCDPQEMGLGPYYSIKKLLNNENMSLKDIDYLEINEAFAAQTLGCYKLLCNEYNISKDELISKTNIYGSGIGLGHPLGCTGARLITTLEHIMRNNDCKYGVASLCIGGGMGIASLLRKVDKNEFTK